MVLKLINKPIARLKGGVCGDSIEKRLDFSFDQGEGPPPTGGRCVHQAGCYVDCLHECYF